MRGLMKKTIVQTFLVLAMAMPASYATAADYTECGNCYAATDDELGALRGGYVAGNGMEILIGIKDTIFVDGVLQVVNTLNLPPLGGGLDRSLPDKLLDKMVTVRQFGAGNSISPALLNSLQSGQYTFIQNSLDHTVIRTVTEINASVTVLDMYRDMNLRSLMNQQLINAMK
jgi:hypothetical protein